MFIDFQANKFLKWLHSKKIILESACYFLSHVYVYRLLQYKQILYDMYVNFSKCDEHYLLIGCNLSKEQINACHVCKSQGGLTANVTLHFFYIFFNVIGLALTHIEYAIHLLFLLCLHNRNVGNCQQSNAVLRQCILSTSTPHSWSYDYLQRKKVLTVMSFILSFLCSNLTLRPMTSY